MPTHMRREIDEIPEAVSRLLSGSGDAIAEAGAALRAHSPAVLVTIARGSSDHAAHFLKYAVELTLGTPVASLGPSLASVYGVTPRLAAGAALAISQSGRSPDIVAMMQAARDGGALTLCLANTLPSPLSRTSDHAIDICAGPEQSVAATKSFVCSLAAGLALVAEWGGDAELRAALHRLPEHLAAATRLDWPGLAEALAPARSLYVLGRGPTAAIAHEAALKFKETCGLHAEAYSTAEVLHGPVEIVGPGVPVLAFAVADAAESGIATTVDGLAQKGAGAFLTAPSSSPGAGSATRLPRIETGHPLLDAAAAIVPFYAFVEAFARQRGRNPDAPQSLRKVTETR